MLPSSRSTMARLAAPLVLLALIGCQRASYSIINMTRCPIRVTYSVANASDSTVTLASGKSAAFGSAPSQLKSVTVTTRDGVAHTYEPAALAKLRQGSTRSKFGWSDDRFGWFDDGLRYVAAELTSFPAADQSCTP